MDISKTLKSTWKFGVVSLTVVSLVAAGLIVPLKSATAAEPEMALIYLGANDGPNSSWSENVTLNQGQSIMFYAEVHNTVVGTTANNVKIKATLPNGSGTSNINVSADNAASVSDSVNIQVNGGGTLQYQPGSTQVNCHGNPQCTDGTAPDGVVGNGINLGDQNGCYEFIIQVTWIAKVVGPAASPSPSPSVSPSPSPSTSPSPEVSPSPSASPTTGGQTQSQSQTQNNNQTVNITNAGSVQGVKVPVKQPETGVGVLGLATMFGAAPLGFALSRYGRGRVIGKVEEDLSEVAVGLVSKRSGNKA